MKEVFLHYVWKFQLFDTTQLQTVENEPVRIQKIGIHNTDSGPDFTQAHIYINNTLWVGDIEIHIRASDWFQHKHEKNPAYNSVILHIVYEYDSEIQNQNGSSIPTVIIPISKDIQHTLQHIEHMPDNTICFEKLSYIDGIYKSAWFDRLVIERFERKARDIIARYYTLNNNWEDTMYETLAKNFGVKTNALAFEALAQSLPRTILMKHAHSLFQLEALLFGQAQLLPKCNCDDYSHKLIQEYSFLQKKYRLTPISRELWKFARMRPANFPTIRIAQFAALLHTHQHICSLIINCENVNNCAHIFTTQLHSYWHTHYRLSQKSTFRIKKMGNTTINTILINTVVPFLFAYGTYTKQDMFTNRALEFLEDLPCEKNSITNSWNKLDIQCNNAFRSQALLELSNNYCTKRKCLQCAFGHKILNNTNSM
ncbi:MAG: DUF2851 family protein [Bacteroidales bacterium]